MVIFYTGKYDPGSCDMMSDTGAVHDYGSFTLRVQHAVRWNPPLEANDGIPLNARECHDHPMVKPTDYIELTRLTHWAGGTNPESPYPWTQVGVLDTVRGKLVVCPGDWVLDLGGGMYLVLSDTQYRNLTVS